MKTFILKVTAESTPGVWRTIEIRDDQTLHDLHRLIASEFDLDDDSHLYAYYLSGRAWDRETEFGGPRTDSPRKARRAQMARLDLVPGKSFLHVFDFGDTVSHRVEVVEVGEAEQDEGYPRILESHGEVVCSHDIWTDPDLPVADREGLKALTEEIRRLLKLDSRQDWRRPYVREDLDVQLDLARRVGEWGRRERPGVGVLEELCDFEILDWLRDLVRDLDGAGRMDEAADLAAGMAELLDEVELLTDRAFVLASAGRVEDARAQAEELLELMHDDPRRIAEAGEVLEMIGDIERAEAVYRRALRIAWHDSDRKEATLRLVPLLRRQNRLVEASRIENDELMLAARGAETILPIRTTPKVGRNDPCPCGSGRKHKKCCGGPSAEALLP